MYGDRIVRQWWWFVLRGALAILFAVLTFLWPMSSLTALVILFGGFALADGAFNLVAAARAGRAGRGRLPLLLQGFLGAAVGIATLFVPGATSHTLLYLVAAWAMAGGAFATVAALRLRKQIHGDLWLALSGVVSIGFGALLMLFPGPGALAVIIWIGAYALLAGTLLVALGLKLRTSDGSDLLPTPRPA